MELTLVYTIIGFGLAGYSVIANDSIQTLGTFIASKQKWFKWYTLASAASLVMIFAITWGWYSYDGDISYGRLTRIPFQEIQWYHAVAPAILLLLNKNWYSSIYNLFSFISICHDNSFRENACKKYYWLWYSCNCRLHFLDSVSKFINEKLDEVKGEKWIAFWRNSVWVSSGWLWWVWLSHDVANIAVYLPRQLDFSLLLIVLAYFTALLFYIFYIQGGPIQKVVLEKTGTRYARSATIINVIYAAVLYYFKELNDLPMSTTWVFVGLLCGRELAISTMNKDYKFKYVFPLIGKDFVKMIFGLSVSVAIVLAIHYFIIPRGLY